jgi:hypothetical protein
MAARNALILTVLLLLARPASGQPPPDFLFDSPNGAIGVRGGWMFARANSDLFTFVQDQLTIDRKDFNAPAIGIDLDLAVTPRVSAAFGFDFTRSTRPSEYRDFVDNQRLPIAQTTSLRETSISGGLKFALTPRVREISSHAWIPAAVTPYIGAGGGILMYEFLQNGDFVDFTDLSVFTGTFRSQGWAPTAHVLGGVDVKVWKRLYVSGEARYLWSHATLERDFSGFDPIDLAGFRLTGGVRYLF